PFVQQEYRRALKRRKQVIPVRYYPTLALPPELQQLHYVDFQAGMNFEEMYATGLQDLLKALAVHTHALAEARAAAQRAEQARLKVAEEKQARRQAQRAQAHAEGARPTSGLLAQPVGRISAVLATVVLIVAFTALLARVGALPGLSTGLRSSDSPSPTGTPSRTTDAAATQTVGALQTVVAAQSATAAPHS